MPKLALGGTLALVAVGLLCLRLLRHRQPLPSSGTHVWRSPAVLAVIPLLLAAVAGIWTSDHAALVVRTLPWLVAGCVFLVATTHLLDENDRKRVLYLLIWPAAALALVGLLQAMELWQPMEFQRRIGARLATTSLAGGAFDLSAYLLLPLILAQERLWSRRGLPMHSARRWIWASAVLLFAGALVATQTLGSILAAIAGSLAFWISLAWRGELPRRRLGLVLGCGAILVLVAVLAVAPLRSRVHQKVRQIQRGDVNVFLTGRLDGWRAALWMAQQRPLTGVGIGGFRAEFGDARLALQDQGVEFHGGHRQPYFVNAHNEVLEILAELGWPGLFAIVWLLWIVGQRSRARCRQRDDDAEDADSWVAFLVATTVAMVVVSLTNFPWRLALIAFPWLLVVASLLDSAHRPDESESEARGSRRNGFAWPVALAVASLVGAYWLFDHGKARVGCQRLVQTAESLALESARRGAMPHRARELGLDMLRRAENLDPAEVAVPITRGGLFMVAGRTEAAERSYRAALDMENRPEIWINLARMRLSAGDRDAAIEAARTAQRLDSRVARKLPEFPELATPKKKTVPAPK
ncbi:MAG: O-antigen ligase family protein [Thermoanaerobaculia bacterium]|nr:O-antigen ligase family protein [Thermoanaerobaculia bacterium]